MVGELHTSHTIKSCTPRQSRNTHHKTHTSNLYTTSFSTTHTDIIGKQAYSQSFNNTHSINHTTRTPDLKITKYIDTTTITHKIIRPHTTTRTPVLKINKTTKFTNSQAQHTKGYKISHTRTKNIQPHAPLLLSVSDTSWVP